jgi:threonine aldolase
MIDLRSDTVTQPTPGMRKAMAQAEVGDDVFGDDPTVIKLEKRVSEILGKETAVYMPSGTMANQVAFRSHTEPGDEILIHEQAHTYLLESGAPAALAGIMCRLLPGERGIFSGKDVRAVIRPRNYHFPHSKLVAVENTHNRGGGSVWPMEVIIDVEKAARENDLKLHLDGARLWNACAATGLSEKEYAEYFDSVSVCFSKGLGAPVGSCLAGSEQFIDRARRFRKMFGGGMRQAGIIAAGALYALDNHRDRLKEDHENAQVLAKGLAEIPGIEVNVKNVETNIVYIMPNMDAAEFSKKLHGNGVYIGATGPHTLRALTSLAVNIEDLNNALEIIRKTPI